MQGFLSYAHEDHEDLTDFRTHLAALKRAFGVTIWTDHEIKAGTVWETAIANAIAAADFFVLLISPAFIASNYVFDQEIPAIRDRRKAANALVLPVIVKRCSWQLIVPSIQAIPTEHRRLKPIADWRPRANGFDAARAEMQAAIQDHFHRAPAVINL